MTALRVGWDMLVNMNTDSGSFGSGRSIISATSSGVAYALSGTVTVAILVYGRGSIKIERGSIFKKCDYLFQFLGRAGHEIEPPCIL